MIPQIKKILYATDLSKNSAYAFYYAVNIAQKRDAKIIIFHAIEPMHPSVTVYWDEKLQKIQKENVEEAIREIEKRLKNFCDKVDSKVGGPCAELVSEIIVRVGYPVEEVLTLADQKGCDLIVMGTHGKGFLQQTFLGSVSRSILDRSRKPVFIIPLPSEKIDIELG
jgi:nucleotide-binding universal stress UspA family protein